MFFRLSAACSNTATASGANSALFSAKLECVIRSTIWQGGGIDRSEEGLASCARAVRHRWLARRSSRTGIHTPEAYARVSYRPAQWTKEH